MSSPSPGPGWWLASDDKWYPQRWEYVSDVTFHHRTAREANEALEARVEHRGQNGWEMVNFAVVSEQSETVNVYAAVNTAAVRHSTWSLLIYWKRPVAP